MTLETPDPIDPLIIDDAVWEQLNALTGGAAAPCYQCGVCTAICPWGALRSEPFSIRQLIRRAQLGLAFDDLDLWLCTTCQECETHCPRGVSITNVIRGLRYLSWQERQTPPALPGTLWSVYWNNNPWTQPPSHRGHWALDLDLPPFDPAAHELLLYIGCTASYDRRGQFIGQALVRLLRAARVPFGYLFDDEPCCGESVLNLGHQPFFEETIQHAAERFEERGVRKLVTLSPHCFDVFKNHWPTSASEIEPYHYSQYLALLLDEGRLHFTNSIERPITFHDPCYLARHNDEIAAPRRVLEQIPGLTLLEMERHGRETLCCGGGGGRMWLETEAGQRFADLRLSQAIASGAEILVTACPFCVACLEDSLASQATFHLTVMDLSELATLALAPDSLEKEKK